MEGILMIICPHCKKIFEEGNDVCPKCGCDLSMSSSGVMWEMSEEETSKKFRKKRAIHAVISIFTVLVQIGLIWILYLTFGDHEQLCTILMLVVTFLGGIVVAIVGAFLEVDKCPYCREPFHKNFGRRCRNCGGKFR